MAQNQIYDPVSQRVVSAQEASALMRERSQEPGQLMVKNPMNTDQSVGFELPPVEGDDAADMLRAFPQLAGLIAQFTPAGRAGFKTAAGVPAVVEALRQVFSGEEIDPASIGVQGLLGMGGHGTGTVISGTGKWLAGKGENVVRKSLNLSGDLKNEVAAEVLPRAAIREGARMTPSGIQAIQRKAQTTGSGALEDLGEAMSQARLNEITSPSRITLWPNELAANFVRQAPRELAIGRTMANTGNAVAATAPAGEAALRALMALASAMGSEGDAEPPLETSRGPRRRGGSQ